MAIQCVENSLLRATLKTRRVCHGKAIPARTIRLSRQPYLDFELATEVNPAKRRRSRDSSCALSSVAVGPPVQRGLHFAALCRRPWVGAAPAMIDSRHALDIRNIDSQCIRNVLARAAELIRRRDYPATELRRCQRPPECRGWNPGKRRLQSRLRFFRDHTLVN